MEDGWTLDVLAERVAEELERQQLGQASGRITARPDGRTIRYYTTLGLIDRPLGTRQRRKLYGERHRQQLIAIKHLQAKGLALYEIQEIMLAATPEELADLAQATRPVAPTHPPIDATADPHGEGFWRVRPASGSPTPRDEASPTTDPDRHHATPPARMAGAVQLGQVTITFPTAAPLNEDDVAALAQAAGPLLAVLKSRGLVSLTPTPR